MESQVVVFQVCAQSYAIEISRVQEIRALSQVTAVPGAPEFVEGLINLRGQVTPVVDLRKRFGLPGGERTKESRIVVVSSASGWVGLVVDSVSEVVRLAEGEMSPPPALASGGGADFVRAVARLGEEKLVLVLDLDRLLGGVEEAMAAAA